MISILGYIDLDSALKDPSFTMTMTFYLADYFFTLYQNWCETHDRFAKHVALGLPAKDVLEVMALRTQWRVLFKNLGATVLWVVILP